MYNSFYVPPVIGNGYMPYNSYTAGYYQPTASQMNQQQPRDTNMVFVCGVEGAKAYQSRPNQSLLLMDSEGSKFYVKTTDNLGMANVTAYSFVEDKPISAGNSPSVASANGVEPAPTAVSAVDNEANEKIKVLTDKVNELEGKLSGLTAKLEEVL